MSEGVSAVQAELVSTNARVWRAGDHFFSVVRVKELCARRYHFTTVLAGIGPIFGRRAGRALKHAALAIAIAHRIESRDVVDAARTGVHCVHN